MSKIKDKYIESLDSINLELRIQEFNKGWANGRTELLWELSKPCPHIAHVEGAGGHQKAMHECPICWNKIVESRNE